MCTIRRAAGTGNAVMLPKISAEPDNANEITRISIDKCVVGLGRGWLMRWVLLVVCLLVFCNSSPAQEKTNPITNPTIAEAPTDVHENRISTTAKLPVRRVVLYKN